MENSLYQKHRPTTFAEVIGQPQVVSVLEKAVKEGTPAHAYLFSGGRGIGKTSIARIFAKELQCHDIDIFEIDAASHTSVEHIRDLSQSIYTQPVRSKRKVYILDEVHMLSKSAFNAFLKTLEEPPAYVTFVLVTTEIDKIPDTVASRCISLEFHQPSMQILKETIKQVAEKENYSIEEQTANLIGLMSEGSFRDTLTLLQKVFASTTNEHDEKSKKTIPHKLAEEVLGAPKQELVHTYLEALATRNIAAGIKSLEELSKHNTNMLLFAKICIQKLRAAVLVQEKVAHILDGYSDEEKTFITEFAKKEKVNVNLLKELIETSQDISVSYIKKLPLEILLITPHR